MSVTSICRSRTFDLHEADELLPVVRRITKEVSLQADRLLDQLERMDIRDSEKTMAVEEKVNELILRWQRKLKKLGLQPRGLWFADFPAEEGCFAWKYPDAFLEYRQNKKEIFSPAAHIGVGFEASCLPASGTHLKDSF